MAVNILNQCALYLFIFFFCGVKDVVGREDLRFYLGGTVYFNNSVIPITDIGTEGSTTPLQCITDLRPCCRGSEILGEWHYPNGSMVIGNGAAEGKYFFFRTRGLLDGTVNLFRRNSGVVSPFGSYCCEIPDTTGVNRTLCANLAPSGFSFVINVSGAVPTIGQSYSLTCSVSGCSVSSYQWWKDGAVLLGQTTVILSFSPLRLSDAGRYTCQVTVTGSSQTFTAYQNHSVIIQSELISRYMYGGCIMSLSCSVVPAPTSVSVRSDQPNPIRPIGSTVTLTCTVVLADYVAGLTVNTEWTGPNGFSENEMAQRMGSNTTYTSTAMVSSFVRDQSGDYNCTATVSSTSSFITNSMGSSSTRVTVGVYLFRDGIFQANNSALFISDISNTVNTRLQCITDTVSCCATDPAGEWFFPDGGMVPIQSSATTFYRNRGDDGTVNLNRINNDVMMPTGRFCCVVPDATGVSQWACAVIFVVQISNGGATPVAGQSYTLTCDTSGATGLTYQWSRNNGDISQESTTQTLSFSTLSLSDGGDYTCTASLGSRAFNITFSLIVQVPEPSSVTVTSNPSTILTFGTNVEVKCTVELSQGLVDSDLSLLMVEAQLSRNGTPLTITGPTVTGTTFTYTIQLDSFVMSHVGEYACTATVSSLSTSAYTTGNGTTTGRATIDIMIVPPPPLNVQATQSSASAPVEVSWSPPSSGATNIIGYRIYYGNGKNVLVPLVVTYVGLALNKDSVGETVSVRSETDQLASQPITVTVTTIAEVDFASSCSCTLEVGVTFGAIFLLVAIVIIVMFLYMLRKRRAGENDLDQSTNMPTQFYDDPDQLTSRGQGNYELTHCPAYESAKPEPPPPRAQTGVDHGQSSH